MPEPLGSEAYTEQLHALLPRGRAWAREPGTGMAALIAAIAQRFAELDGVFSRLLEDIRPNTTVDLLPEWERLVGLPDDCSALGAGLLQRRGAVLDKIVSQPNLNPSSYEALAAKMGAEITIAEHDQARAGRIAGLDTTNGKWRFVWWVRIDNDSTRFFTTLSDTETPLVDFDRNTELECRLRKAAPAHTHLVVGYA